MCGKYRRSFNCIIRTQKKKYNNKMDVDATKKWPSFNISFVYFSSFRIFYSNILPNAYWAFIYIRNFIVSFITPWFEKYFFFFFYTCKKKNSIETILTVDFWQRVKSKIHQTEEIQNNRKNFFSFFNKRVSFKRKKKLLRKMQAAFFPITFGHGSNPSFFLFSAFLFFKGNTSVY